MWSGRFRQPLDPEFKRWQRSFPFDRRLLEQELAASRAHAQALAKAGILSAADVEAITSGLRRIAEQAAKDPQSLNDPDAEDVHDFVERSLVKAAGEVGYKLHTGRSRNEQIATDLRLWTRARIDELQLLLADWLEALLARAAQAGAAAMPSYTHLQPAEPVLVSHWLLAYAEMFFRDVERLAACRRHLNQCPLGSGAVAGATLALDRAAMAAELGFDKPTANSMDATSDRDFALEFVMALSLLGAHLSRFAEEMILFSTPAFGFVHLPESHSTGSSAMPQKQNADAMELIRGQAGRLAGEAVSLVVTMKGLPLAYNKDLQEAQQPVYSAAETAAGMLRVATGFLRAVQFDQERMRAAAQSDFMNAMAAAQYLAEKGVPFRRAHEHVGEAVRLCLDKGCKLEDLSLKELREINPSFGDDFPSRLALESVLALHDVPGGTAPAQVEKALAQARSRLNALRGGAHARS